MGSILDPRARASKTPLTKSSEHDFKCHLNPSAPPPPGAWKFMKVRSKNEHRNRTLFGYDFRRHLDASGGHLASILDQIGVDFGPPDAVGEISRN